MNTFMQIPGVKLEVYKQNRLLAPEKDGYMGQLFAGFATILAIVEPNVDKTFSIFRDGKDNYSKPWDWLANPDQIKSKDGKEKQHRRQEFLGSRSFQPGTQVFGLKIPLRVFEHGERVVNSVHYPENMMMLAQYYCEGSPSHNSSGYVLVWKIALVSQNGEFFLTVQEAYDVMICQQGSEKPRIPRLRGHRQLEQLILANAPENFRFCTRHEDPLPNGGNLSDLKLGSNEGVVDRWYAAKNMGVIITAQGPARVHWTETLPSPRLRCLKDGERVTYSGLGTPPINPATQHRPMRKAQLKLQALGVQPVSDE